MKFISGCRCGLAVLVFVFTTQVVAQDAVEKQELTAAEHFALAKEFIEEKRDSFSAMLHLKPAADAGYVRAQVWYAQFSDYGEENVTAEKYFKMAVAQGDSEAKMGLAIMHVVGDVAEPDLAVALNLIREAAQDGFKPAVASLAAAYIKGGLGLDDEARASVEALEWINKAADQGEIVALEKQETIYREGGYGVPVDLARANEIRSKINELTGFVEKEETGRRRRK